ncbi:hypothetical protein OC845_005685 [Tilletia horrida]|nr:hypothetical protein OC845_005685 [Tilletia horrida]
MALKSIVRNLIDRAWLLTTSAPQLLLTGRTAELLSLPTFQPGVGAAPTHHFNASQYIGTEADPAIWYQLASSHHRFDTGCSCTSAKYASLPNGSIALENFCTRNHTERSSVGGIAVPTAEKFGEGTFQVRLGPSAGNGPCGPEAPNYIVAKAYQEQQKHHHHPGDDGVYQTVIIGEQNFEGWFLLSRDKEAPRHKLEDVAKLGFNLSQPYTLTDQTHCAPP